MPEVTGRSMIGFQQAASSTEQFYATNPATGEQLRPGFYPATQQELEHAAELAFQSFAVYGRTSGKQRGAFLRSIAANLESMASDLVERAQQETALPKARLQGETARTCGQLRMFAEVVEAGSWVDARIDRALPERKPAPRSDIRSMQRPLGAVAVFGASNFPLAFSVAGGDTASAFAAGNPVIVKAHPAHPGTSELAAQAIRASVRESGLPEGVFSLLFDSGTEIGTALVKHPRIQAVGFTGSRRAGRALMDVAASRPEPIPFFAEMSSTNPVFVLPGAMRERGEAIAAALHTSFTLGAGQFCTKPGMVFVGNGPQTQTFVRKLRGLAEQAAEYHLLTEGIRCSYQSAISARKQHVGVKSTAVAPASELAVGAALFETDAASFLRTSALEDEIFGPTTLLVEHSRREELLEIARRLEGHLTATIHGTVQDLTDYAELVRILETKVGRLVFNWVPTGVEVSHAMVHGGPYPATSDSRFTSVGSRAIFRFAHPVCYQDFPDSALPDELKDSNPLGIWRMIDGNLSRDGITR